MSTSSNQTKTYDFQSLSVEELFKKLAASSKGLSAEEASKRVKDHGYNENGKGNGDRHEDGDRGSCGHCQDDFR